MPKYRKKPVVVEAVQFTDDPAKDPPGVFRREEDLTPFVVTIHNQKAFLSPGDWIILEPDGIHYYPCKPDIFEATYEVLPEDHLALEGRIAKLERVLWAAKNYLSDMDLYREADCSALKRAIAAVDEDRRRSNWEQWVLDSCGLSQWKVRYKPSDGYCWRDTKTIDSIKGDKALFLHEVAHALTPKGAKNEHDGRWASHYTNLVRRYLVAAAEEDRDEG